MEESDVSATDFSDSGTKLTKKQKKDAPRGHEVMRAPTLLTQPPNATSDTIHYVSYVHLLLAIDLIGS